MANYFVTTSFVTSGNAFTMASGDSLFLAANTNLASTGFNYGIYDPGYGAVEIDGTVYGGAGVTITGASGSTSYLYVDKAGIVASDSGGTAVYVGFNHQIVNNGQITSIGNSGWGIEMTGAGSVVNNGSITAGYAFISVDNTASDILYTYNNGSITGNIFAYYDSGSATNYFVNQGSSNGAMTFGSGATDTLYNTGLLDVSPLSGTQPGVSFGNGASDMFINKGTITDSVNDTAGPAKMLSFGNGANVFLYNSGVIELVGSHNSGSTAITMGSGAGDTVFNDANGAILGNIVMGSGSGQTVGNSGAITGSVTLGNGAGEVYFGVDGTITGTITAGNGGDSIYAGKGATTVVGGSAGDYIVGGAGTGTFTGGGGGDYMVAGGGADTFVYNSVTDSNSTTGADLISNFRSGYDHINLHALGISAAATSIYSSASATSLQATSGGNTLVIYFNTPNALTTSDIIF
jgi:hypothetical protein